MHAGCYSRYSTCIIRTPVKFVDFSSLSAVLFCEMQSLLLLTYLLRNGSERVVTSTREHLHDLRVLEQYVCVDEHGRDQGMNGMFTVVQLDN